MKTLLFDPLSGASGNTILGSLIDLGADVGKIRKAVESAVDVALTVERTRGSGVDAATLTLSSLKELPERNYHELVDIIRGSRLPGIIEKDVLSVFEIMANAEAKIQGNPLEHLSFQETKQIEALAGVIGSCTALRELHAESVLTTPINGGSGTDPVSLEIMKTAGLPFYGRGDRDLLTPTGAALLAHFAQPVDNIPLGRALTIGYGANEDAETPDLLRTLLMELKDGNPEDLVEVLETNVDNVSGEILGNLFDRLLKLGARDVTISPVTMKKGRPGQLIRVISLPHTSAILAREIMRETGTLGIRVMTGQHRFAATNRMGSVTLSIGDKRFETPVKIASDQAGDIILISAEYEACREIANAVGIPLREVTRRTEEEAWKRFGAPSS